MVRVLITNWWLLLLRGVFALGFAIFVFVFQPFVFTRFLKAVAFTGIAELFGVLAAIMGVITIVASLRGSQAKHHAWMLLAEGGLLAIVGAAVIFIPNLGLAEVVCMIAAASLLAGVLEIVAGAHLRRHLADEWVLILCGATTVVFAGSLFLFVARDVAAIITSIGIYAGLTGAAMVALALRLRSLRHSVHVLAEHALAAKAR